MGLFAFIETPLDFAILTKRVLPLVLLVSFWQRDGRLGHGLRNLAIAVFNTVVLGLVFVSVTVAVAHWTEANQFGVLHVLELSAPIQFGLALVLLDGWMYWWHRANHVIPFLWRFHRMHHSDRHMDVTTATRFHLGEHVGSSVIRLGLIPLFGFEVWHLVVYDMLVIVVTQFHHADISIGRLDPWLRWLVVTPDMHKMHHSDWQPETDSNYSTVLSIWDRLFGSFRMRANVASLVFGLKEFTEPAWQSMWGMAKTPFVYTRVKADSPVATHGEVFAKESDSMLVS